MLKAEDFFDLGDTVFPGFFDQSEYVWEGLKNIKKYIQEILEPNVSPVVSSQAVLDHTVVFYQGKWLDQGFELLPGDAAKGKFIVKMDGKVLEGASVIYAGAALMDDRISIGRGTVIEPGALIKGPTVIGDFTEVRQGAYIRGNVLIGPRCVVGHTTEIKSSVMLGESKAGHFAYIGDSILGKVNLGAGTKCANLKIIASEVKIRAGGKVYSTGLKKFGAIMGDGVETGCNTVTTPGTLLGKEVKVYPNSMVKGFCPANSIVKLRQNQEIKTKG